jgi:hypothetical protein
VFGFLGSLASAIFPAAAPFIAAAGALGRVLTGGGGPVGGSSPPDLPPLPPPPPPLSDPRVGTVTPMPNGDGPGASGGTGIFQGGDITGPTPVELTPGEMAGTLPMGGAVLSGDPTASALSLPVETTSGGFDVQGALNALGGIPGLGAIVTPAAMIVSRGMAQGAMQLAGGAGVRGMIPAIENVVGKTLISAGIGAAIYETYRALRLRGFAHKAAKYLAHLFHGVRKRRRRMRVTNVHALRRAIRRVHGFKRVCRKVGALGVGARGRLVHHRYGRKRRRGDLDPFLVETRLEQQDEWEDEGGEPETFPVGAEE